MTHTQGADATRRPSTTAPPSPPQRVEGSRWMSATATLSRRGSCATTASVPSSESSTKMTSIGWSGNTRASRSTSGWTLPASLRVGTMTDTTGTLFARRRAFPDVDVVMMLAVPIVSPLSAGRRGPQVSGPGRD